MAKNQQVSQPAPEAPPEPTVQNSNTDLVNITGLADDVTVRASEVNQAVEHAKRLAEHNAALAAVQPTKPEQTFTADDYIEAWDENSKRDFTYNVLAARQAPAFKEYTPPPVPAGISAATNAEIEAGRRQLAKHQENLQRAQELQPNRLRRDNNTGMVAVFSPDDYTQPPLTRDAAQHQPTQTYRTLG